MEARWTFNLKAMGLVPTHARHATKSVGVKTAEETAKPQAAAPKLGAGDDFMKSMDIMKYNIDADPMTNDIDAKEAKVEAHLQGAVHKNPGPPCEIAPDLRGELDRRNREGGEGGG